MDTPPDIAIRMRRAAFNRALADGDITAIGPILGQGVILVTGTDSAVLVGRQAQLHAWKQEFGDRDRPIYTRTPDSVILSTTEPIALEQGQWQGIAAESGRLLASGLYNAKWREIAGKWMIEAEIFVTLV